jgi:hypothetical protein
LGRNHKFIFVTSLELTFEPIEFPLGNGGETFWLDDRTVSYVVEDDESKKAGLYSISPTRVSP